MSTKKIVVAVVAAVLSALVVALACHGAGANAGGYAVLPLLAAAAAVWLVLRGPPKFLLLLALLALPALADGFPQTAGAVVVTNAAATSSAATAIAPGTCYRVTCSVDSQFRVCPTGTCVAVATDNELQAKFYEQRCARQKDLFVAFISTAGGTCKLAPVYVQP